MAYHRTVEDGRLCETCKFGGKGGYPSECVGCENELGDEVKWEPKESTRERWERICKTVREDQ